MATTPSADSLGAFLKRRREVSGLSQAAVSERANLSETYYGKVEKGLRRPSDRALTDILAVLDIAKPERQHALWLRALQGLPASARGALESRLHHQGPEQEQTLSGKEEMADTKFMDVWRRVRVMYWNRKTDRRWGQLIVYVEQGVPELDQEEAAHLAGSKGKQHAR